jgi:1-acyl-sn-glycerol-3-phosphate acyltransferase
MLKIIFKIYFWLIAAPIFVAVTIVISLTVITGCLLGGERFFSYYPGMIWSKITCLLTLCPIKVEGRENLKKKQSYVFVANHQSAYDIFLVYGFLGAPVKWMMKKELAVIPFVGTACRMAGFVFVDSTSARKAQKSLFEAEEILKHNRSLVIFPEGSRTADGKIDKFKKGAFRIAVEQGLPIAPITLNGPYNVMKIGSFDIMPHKMEMIIHKPVYPNIEKIDDNQFKKELQMLSNETRETIYSALWDCFK